MSDFDFDRANERFSRAAFDGALAKLQDDRRALPVLFGHDQRTATAVIGHVPPDGWQATGAGLIARGWIDTAHDVARHVYKMLKSGALQWSIGFTTARSKPLRGGGHELQEVGELYELSVVPIPANQRTRTLSLKGYSEDEDVDELREQCEQLQRELMHEGIITPDVMTFASRPERELRNGDQREKARQAGFELMACTAAKATDAERTARDRTGDTRVGAEAREPLQIARFDA